MGVYFSTHEFPLRKFLQQSKHEFSKLTNGKATVVIGNEASDMDSIVCSIIYAYYLKSKNPSAVVIPVMNIASEDFVLRTETNWLFGRIALNEDDLEFLPDIKEKFDKLHKEGNLELVLVDHNRLAVSQEQYEKSVIEIVDHHKEENRCPNAKPPRRLISMEGSCCTLVAEKAFADTKIITKVEAMLLLGPILLDTANMDPQQKKATPRDIAIAEKLFQIAGLTPENRLKYYEDLVHHRFSVDALTTYDLLRCDYKQWTMNGIEVGVGACKKPINGWVEMDKDFKAEFAKYMDLRELNILFAMTQFFVGKDMFRELIVYCPTQELMDRTCQFLLKSDLELEEIKVPNLTDSQLKFFNQKNTAASRKQLQPLLVDNYEQK
eukprot:TRINITY_DN2275_c0_g1_i1.p1 TRINITY_DN2275_c0_g1~~TRINITY_DN2275_c0_g1_i1.p1  ORF type:complete len:395 (+),score=112.49 TRINITY_DN2275_c0_g1_i1:50-1186(+)